jgi:predicted adenylyl cyclase CyaB
MPFEVEIKAHVRDPLSLKTALEGRYGPGQRFYKSDRYFDMQAHSRDIEFQNEISKNSAYPAHPAYPALSAPPLPSPPSSPRQGPAFRLRFECSAADLQDAVCQSGTAACADCPAQEKEQNRILNHCAGPECLVTAKRKSMHGGVEVNDEIEFSISDSEAFCAFSAMLGYSVSLEKGKAGYSWAPAPQVTIELAEVKGLGHFIEIEEMVEDSAAIPAARTRVLELLVSLGFGEQDVEPRYYTDMLRECGATALCSLGRGADAARTAAAP